MRFAPGAFHANHPDMAGNKQQKKAGARKEHAVERRQRDFEQPIAKSVAPERAVDVSNFTDGEIAGPDHKHDPDGRLKRKPPVSEPRRRS
jgi:hypothetical protein